MQKELVYKKKELLKLPNLKRRKKNKEKKKTHTKTEHHSAVGSYDVMQHCAVCFP